MQTFYLHKRELIKASVSRDVLAYIEALEAVARAASTFWEIIETQTFEQIDPSNALYDALLRIDFMATTEATSRPMIQFQHIQEEALQSNLSRGQEEAFAVLRQALKKFGDLLRQVCEVGGFTLEKLSQEAKAELQRLTAEGKITPEDPVGSLEEPILAKVIAGVEVATYYQVSIWLAVLGRHLNSKEFAEICQALNIDIPDISEMWRQ